MNVSQSSSLLSCLISGLGIGGILCFVEAPLPASYQMRLEHYQHDCLGFIFKLDRAARELACDFGHFDALPQMFSEKGENGSKQKLDIEKSKITYLCVTSLFL